MNKELTPLENFMDLVGYLAKRVKTPRMSGKTILEDAEMQKTIEQIKIVEKSLKALEIIKKQKCIHILALKSSVDKGAYNQFILPLNRYLGIKLFDKLTQEEYDLLKGVLL